MHTSLKKNSTAIYMDKRKKNKHVAIGRTVFVLMALERDPLLLLSTFIHACQVSPNEWDLTGLCR